MFINNTNGYTCNCYCPYFVGVTIYYSRNLDKFGQGGGEGSDASGRPDIFFEFFGCLRFFWKFLKKIFWKLDVQGEGGSIENGQIWTGGGGPKTSNLPGRPLWMTPYMI